MFGNWFLILLIIVAVVAAIIISRSKKGESGKGPYGGTGYTQPDEETTNGKPSQQDQ